MDHCLSVTDLVVDRAGREVLRGVSLDIERGIITALLGVNGAGKSTLVSTVAGTLPARSGSVMLGGKNILGLKPHIIRRLGVAIVSEGHPVLSDLSVRDNLRAAGLMLTAAEAEQRVDAVLEMFPELEPKFDLLAGTLSGGQKQMVNIAQALIARPQFLLIDELSLGLAPSIVTRLGSIVQKVARDGVGVLLIEQFTSLALSISERAHVLERGRLVYSGSSAELKSKPEILHGAYLAHGGDRR